MARFIGGQNVMSGTMEGLANGHAAATGQGGSRLLIPIGESPVARSAVVFASARRDRIETSRLAAGAKPELEANTVARRVDSIKNQSSHVKVTIDLGAPEEFVALVCDEAFFRKRLEIGDRVLAHRSVEDVRILETPDSTR